MWINNSIVEKLIDKDSEIPEGFVKGRLKRPKKIDYLIQIVSKEDLIQYYIIDNHSFIDTKEHFNLEYRKDLRVLVTHYQIAKDLKQAAKYTRRTRNHESYVKGGKKSGETQKKNWENKSDEEKKEWSDKQKIAHSTEHFKKLISEINIEYAKNLDADIKKDMDRRRSESCKRTWSNPELIAQQKQTAKKNRLLNKESGQICRTAAEQRVYDCLLENGFDVIYDELIDDRYPYYVDFYIKSLDLFIEYQGYPSHGSYPYIEGDSKSINEANRLYGDWRNQYLHTDVEKYNKAVESDINFIRIYPNSSLEENFTFNNNKFNDIIELIYNIK